MDARISSSEALLEVRGLQKHFPIQCGFLRRTVGYVKAVDDVSFTVRVGETVGLVGESGCGKTTAGRCIIRLYEPTGGQALFRTAALSGADQQVDLLRLTRDQWMPLRQEIAMIFQDPINSLNPRMTVGDIVAEPLVIHGKYPGAEREAHVVEMLRRVGLLPQHLQRYPHEFSGGQRQRIGIARALALNPRLVICDEPVSALDVSIQAQTLNLLQDLQGELGLSFIFIAHDLSVVQHISDRIVVMYVGKVAEIAPSDELYGHPLHPYTEALLSAVPKPDPLHRSQRILMQGDVADPANPPSGCYFHPRCSYAVERCRVETPALRALGPEHQVACHRAGELSLRAA